MTPKLFTTLRSYDRAQAGADAVAGLTVAMVAIPLSIAIAIASGATPSDGLVTAIVGGFLVSLLGGSRVQIGGPTGAFIVVVYGVIAAHGRDGLILATAMAGLWLLIAGALRAGSLVAFVPEPVIHGFTLGIAAIIGLSQVADLFGLDATGLPADAVGKVAALWAARGTADGAALVAGLGTMALIVLFRRLAPRLPGLIVAVALVSVLAALAGLGLDTVQSRFGAMRGGLPAPAIPAITRDRLVELFPASLVIAFLAAVESLLSAMVADRMIAGRHRPNAEVVAQGAANLGSALFGGLPVTGAIARTATNVRAGGRTPVAGLVHAVAILAVMLVAAPLAGQLAMPALAGLLILTAWNMADPPRIRQAMGDRTSDRVLYLLVFALTVLADLTVAILVGVAIGLALRLRRRQVPPADWTPPDR